MQAVYQLQHALSYAYASGRCSKRHYSDEMLRHMIVHAAMSIQYAFVVTLPDMHMKPDTRQMLRGSFTACASKVRSAIRDQN